MQVMRIAMHDSRDIYQPGSRRERDAHAMSFVMVHCAPIPMLRMLATRPTRFVRALRLAWHIGAAPTGRTSPSDLSGEACRILPWLRSTNVMHVHAHFGTNSAEVAMLLHELGGPRWSFTVHGPEEFDKAPLIGWRRRCGAVRLWL